MWKIVMKFLASPSNPHISPLELPGARPPPLAVSTGHFLALPHPQHTSPSGSPTSDTDESHTRDATVEQEEGLTFLLLNLLR